MKKTDDCPSLYKRKFENGDPSVLISYLCKAPLSREVTSEIKAPFHGLKDKKKIKRSLEEWKFVDQAAEGKYKAIVFENQSLKVVR